MSNLLPYLTDQISLLTWDRWHTFRQRSYMTAEKARSTIIKTALQVVMGTSYAATRCVTATITMAIHQGFRHRASHERVKVTIEDLPLLTETACYRFKRFSYKAGSLLWVRLHEVEKIFPWVHQHFKKGKKKSPVAACLRAQVYRIGHSVLMLWHERQLCGHSCSGS